MTLESVNENPVLRHTFEFALLVDAYTAHLYTSCADTIWRGNYSVPGHRLEPMYSKRNILKADRTLCTR